MATVEEGDSTPMVRDGPREHRATVAGYWSLPESSKSSLNVTASDVAETHRLPKGRND